MSTPSRSSSVPQNASGPAGVDPFVMMLPVTLAASCAFMLPVATPPNAIVYGSGSVSVQDMLRAGILLDVIGVFVVSLLAVTVGRLAFNGL